MLEELTKRCVDYTKHISAISGISGYVLDTQQQRMLYSTDVPRFCEGCTYPRCVEMNTHLYGCHEAYRWNGQYIYYCPLGLVFTSSSVSDDSGSLVGGITLGPVIMGEFHDSITEVPETMREQAAQLPKLSTSMVSHVSSVLSAVAAYAAGIPHSRAGGFVYEQEKILKAIYSAQEKLYNDDAEESYPIETEKELQELIRSHNKDGAQKLLNDLLGHIYCANHFNLAIIKTRIMELVVILSRAAIDAGADIHEVFLFNTNYLQEIDQFVSLEDLSVWLTGIMHRFINYSFDFAQVRHSNIVYKVMEYVKSNYNRKITLEDVAKSVYLSRTYLSSLFKEETGQSLFSYINSVRVEKSKIYLLDASVSLVDISSLCGFEDQSYFTKVFKKTTGMSPKKYRDCRLR